MHFLRQSEEVLTDMQIDRGVKRRGLSRYRRATKRIYRDLPYRPTIPCSMSRGWLTSSIDLLSPPPILFVGTKKQMVPLVTLILPWKPRRM